MLWGQVSPGLTGDAFSARIRAEVCARLLLLAFAWWKAGNCHGNASLKGFFLIIDVGANIDLSAYLCNTRYGQRFQSIF